MSKIGVEKQTCYHKEDVNQEKNIIILKHLLFQNNGKPYHYDLRLILLNPY